MAIILAYISVVLIWSTTPLAIVWSGETDWFFGVAARTLIGALVILPLLWWKRSKQPAFRVDFNAIRVYAMAAMPIFGGMTLMYWSSQYLPSGWIAIVFAMTPVTTGIIAHYLLPDKRLTPRKAVAIALSLSGLWLIFAPNLESHLLGLQVIAILVALFSVVLHSLGSVLVKRCGTSLPSLHIVIGALWLAVLGHLVIDPTALLNWPELQARESLAIVYAGVIGSVVGFLLYFYLVRHVDAMKVALIPMITPVFAILIGHFLNDEQLSLSLWFGTAIVIVGLILFEWRFRPSGKPH